MGVRSGGEALPLATKIYTSPREKQSRLECPNICPDTYEPSKLGGMLTEYKRLNYAKLKTSGGILTVTGVCDVPSTTGCPKVLLNLYEGCENIFW